MMSIATGCPKLTTTFCNIYQGGCATWKYQVWALHGWNLRLKTKINTLFSFYNVAVYMATEGCGTMNVCVMPSLRCGKTPGLGSLDLIHFTLFHTAPDQFMPVGTVAVAATKPIATAQPDIITCEILLWNQSRKKKNLKNMSPSASIKGNLDKKIWLTNGSIVEHRITLNITTPQQYTTSTSHYFTNALPPKHIASTMHHLNVT
jgi:hypothetical protein